MAAPNFWGGKICIATVNINGKINPVPIPWIIRPKSNWPKPLAVAEITAPTKKSAKAKITVCLVVNHLEIKLEKGKIIPIINM